MARQNFAADLSLNEHHFVRRAGADFVEIKWNVVGDDFCNQDRPDWRLRRLFLFNSALQGARDSEGGQNDEEEDTPSWNARLLFADRLHAIPFLDLGRGAIPRIYSDSYANSFRSFQCASELLFFRFRCLFPLFGGCDLALAYKFEARPAKSRRGARVEV